VPEDAEGALGVFARAESISVVVAAIVGQEARLVGAPGESEDGEKKGETAHG
jgi:hypothetical protein